MTDAIERTPAPPPMPCWIRPDGSVLPAPDGLDAPIRVPGSGPLDPGEARAQGWVGARPAGDAEWWEILPPVAGPTMRAYKAAAALVRRPGSPTPERLVASLHGLIECFWDDERHPGPGPAVEARLARLVPGPDARIDAAAAARGEGPHLPDVARLRTAQAEFARAIAPMYGAAHGWHYGPALAEQGNGGWSRDPAVLRAGVAEAARVLLACTALARSSASAIRGAVLGIDESDVPDAEAPPGSPHPDPLVALTLIPAMLDARLEAKREVRLPRLGPGALLHPEARKEATRTINEVSSLRRKLENVERDVETCLNLLSRLPPDADYRAIDRLASGLLSHECGRTALELGHAVNRWLPVQADRLAEACAAAAPGIAP